MAEIFPPSMEMLRSATAAAPVPSMSSTCSRITFEATTLTYLRTCGERASLRWAQAGLADNMAREEMAKHRTRAAEREKHVDIDIVVYLAGVTFSKQNSKRYAPRFPGRPREVARRTPGRGAHSRCCLAGWAAPSAWPSGALERRKPSLAAKSPALEQRAFS